MTARARRSAAIRPRHTANDNSAATPKPIATNTIMFDRLVEDMDVNAGRILDGAATVEEMGAEIYAHLLRVASGEMTKSEAQGLGDHEFVPWQIGAVM